MAGDCFYGSIRWGESSKHKLLLICDKLNGQEWRLQDRKDTNLLVEFLFPYPLKCAVWKVCFQNFGLSFFGALIFIAIKK